MFYLWIGALSVFLVLELLTPQLVSIWFAVGSLGGLVAYKLSAPEWLQITVFAIVAVIALALTRPLYKKYVQTKIVPTNSDRLIGRQAVVVEDIDNISAKGSVKIDGQFWSARSVDDDPIAKDTVVNVERIEGVKLIVNIK
ncbi:MAG: NfeD family protein [Ruminococcaceae bacterium]|nr:NfeD family protein [Oscillospiraceae bacterium]